MRIKRRTRSRAGFTLAETMLAVLILLMVASIVAAGIPVARNAYEKVILGSNAQVLLSTAVNALRDEVGTARETAIETIGGKSCLTYLSGDTLAKSRLYISPDSKSKNTIWLQEYVSVTGFNESADSVGTGHPLVSEAAATRDLNVYYDSVRIEGDVVRFVNLRVCHGSAALAVLTESGSSDLIVRPISVQKVGT